MMWNDGYGMGAWMAGGWLWMALATVAFILLVAWAARSLGSSNNQHTQPGPSERPSALEALDMRYAKGEISEDEYKKMRHNLTGA
jgi:putative membrane protein